MKLAQDPWDGTSGTLVTILPQEYALLDAADSCSKRAVKWLMELWS